MQELKDFFGRIDESNDLQIREIEQPTFISNVENKDRVRYILDKQMEKRFAYLALQREFFR